MMGKVSAGCMIFYLLLAASIADARLWPWPEDFEEVKARRLGERFITEEEGDSLVKQDLCFDCHDGSVLDNRELWDPSLHGHRVDILPKQPLPEGIPLFDGKLYCGSCHLPHGDLPGAQKDVKKPYLRYENTNDVFCVACHQERATPGPQGASRNHSFLKKARSDTATADPQAWERIQGLGGRVGKGGATRCQSCHRPHGGPSRSALITYADRSELCSICHHDIKDSSTRANHPLHQKNPWEVENRPRTVECLTCHRVHEAPVPGVLLAEEGEGLCLHCHAKRKLAENDIHRQERFTKRLRESPESRGGGSCGACHILHRAQGKFLAVAVAEASGLDPDSRFCAGCHERMKEWVENQIGPHYHFLGPWPKNASSGVMLPPAETLPLLTPQGVLPGAGEKEAGNTLGCRTCHYMHDRPDGLPPDRLMKNLRQDFRNGGLCLACHEDRVTILETKHNPSRLENPEIRARFPVEDGNPCSMCHVVHRAQTRNLCPEPLFLTPETDPQSAACLRCHGQGTGKAETTIGDFFHPLGPWPADASDFGGPYRLPETLPLLEPVSEAAQGTGPGTKGSVSCSTCHRLHFGKDEKRSEKDLRPAISGPEACTICHEGQKILSKTKHSIRTPDRVTEIENYFGKVDEQHECTPCHRVHNARGPGLWFTELPEPENTYEQDERSRRCLICHLKEPFKRIQEANGHPIGRPMKTQYLPSAEAQLMLGRIAQDEAGQRDVVVCATCHLNHGRQNPDGTITLFAGGGLPDGDLCIVCHQEKVRIVGSPHDFRAREEGQFHPDEGRSLKFGVCAGCHANHNARIEQGLIAFAFSVPKGEGNPEDMFCLYCHRKPEVMKDRRIKFYVHPSGPKVKEKLTELKEKEALPPQGRLGEPARTTLSGYEALFRIHCTTCHDNHRWTGLSLTEATELERTEMASFLRGSEVARTLCSNCHGAEALYRYRLYHQDRSWRLKIPNE